MRESLVDRGSVERLFLVAGAVRAGLIDALAAGEPLTAAEVAAAANADLRATQIVLEALAAEGLAAREGEIPAPPPVRATKLGDRPGGAQPLPGAREALYRLTPVAREHLVDPGPQLERWGLLHQARKASGWLELPQIIRTGEPTPRDPAKRDIKTMVSAMGERDPNIVDELVDKCLAYAALVETMLDVGGAVGHVARAFSRCGVRATLFDRPAVMALAREYLGDEANDIALMGGDLTQALPAGPFDLVFFGNVLHIYSPATNARVIREAYSILRPGGAIGIHNYLWGRSPRAPMFAVNMLQSVEDGGVWSEAMYREWLSEAGFAKIETFDLETGESQLLLATRPPTETGD
jgi:SAM-dependent methyltransferase